MLSKTLILLDGDVVDAETVAYFVFENALRTQTFSKSRLVWSSFDHSLFGPLAKISCSCPRLGSTDYASTSSQTNGTVKIALAAAYVSVSIKTIFSYKLWHQTKRTRDALQSNRDLRITKQPSNVGK